MIPGVPDFGVGPTPEPGTPHDLAPGLTRVTAPNPGLMTGPGTNTYLIGTTELAVIDPGPDEASHRGAVLRVAVLSQAYCGELSSPESRPLTLDSIGLLATTIV